MKPKNKSAPLPPKHQDNNRKNEEHRREAKRRLWLRLGAIFMAIVFLASECSSLILLE
jgi:hypothetical protein